MKSREIIKIVFVAAFAYEVVRRDLTTGVLLYARNEYGLVSQIPNSKNLSREQWF